MGVSGDVENGLFTPVIARSVLSDQINSGGLIGLGLDSELHGTLARLTLQPKLLLFCCVT